MEKDEPRREELPTEPAQNVMNEIIEESDFVIEGFEALENWTWMYAIKPVDYFNRNKL